MENFMKKNAIASIIASLLFLIIGISIVTNPGIIILLTSYFLGGLFIIIGLVKIISYLVNRKELDIYSYELLFGIIAISLGIFTITCSDSISSFFRIIIGLWIIYSAIIRIICSIRLKNTNIKLCTTLFLIAILMLIVGFYVVFNAGTLIVSMGIIIIIYSILDLVESVAIYVNLSKLD